MGQDTFKMVILHRSAAYANGVDDAGPLFIDFQQENSELDIQIGTCKRKNKE